MFNMRLVAALPVLGCALVAPAQDIDQDELIARRDKKLVSEFLNKADWITDYDAARAKAKESGKPIFAYFTRSFQP